MDWFYYPVSKGLAALYEVFSPSLGESSGVTWTLMVVVLTLVVRALLLPFNLQQWHAQQKLGALQPRMGELTREIREELERIRVLDIPEDERRQEQARVRMEHLKRVGELNAAGGFRGRNLLLPLVVQIVVGVMLFGVLQSLRNGTAQTKGVPADTATAGQEAAFFGAPFTSSFLAPASDVLDVDSTTVRLVVLGLVLVTTAISMLSYRMSLRRNREAQGAVVPAGLQKQLLRLPYYLFALAGAFYLLLPVGLLLAALTTASWMALYQQTLIAALHRRRSEGEDGGAPGP